MKTKKELGSLHLGFSFPYYKNPVDTVTKFRMYSFVTGNYLLKIKPIALSKERRQNPHAETTAQEKHQLRGLHGSTNWTVTKLMLYGAASLSVQAASVEKSIVEDVHEANKNVTFL